MSAKSKFLSGPRIAPTPITGGLTVERLIETTFFAYNAGKLARGCRLFTDKMLAGDATVGLTVAGALTPAGLGISTIGPLVDAGFVDWIVSTGANLYHDTHFGLGLALHQGQPELDDVVLREEGSSASTTSCSTTRCCSPPTRSSAARPGRGAVPANDGHGRVPLPARQLSGGARGEASAWRTACLLTSAHRCGVPIYTSSPGDSARSA